MKIVSKIGHIRKPSATIYEFLSDFRNFEKLVPADKIQDWTCTSDTCSFSIMGIGKASLKITEKTPVNFIKINSDQETPVKFALWADISPIDETSSELIITIDPDINLVMFTMIKSQLKSFLDMLVGEVEKIK